MLYLIYLLAFAPYCAFWGVLAYISYTALKGGPPRGMHPVSSSIGQSFCLVTILFAPGMLLLIICLLGLLGSAFIGWGVPLISFAGWLHDTHKSRITTVVAVFAGLLGLGLAVTGLMIFLPYPPIDFPQWMMRIQHIPVLNF